MDDHNKTRSVFTLDNNENHVDLELAKVQLRLFGFICKLTGDFAPAEDILQNVNVAVWRKRHEYDPARPFFTWVCAFAKVEVLRHRKAVARERRMFSETFIEEMAGRLAEPDPDAGRRLAFLEQCRRELSGNLRQMIEWFYGERLAVADIAKRLGRNTGSVANSLYYARHLLRMCIEGKIAAEDRA